MANTQSSGCVPAEIAERNYDGGGDMPQWQIRLLAEHRIAVAKEKLATDDGLVTAIYGLPELDMQRLRRIVADSPALKAALTEIASEWSDTARIAELRLADDLAILP